MKFIVAPEIFEKLPNMYVGVVVAHGIDNHQKYSEIDKMLENTNSLLSKILQGLMLKNVQKLFLIGRHFGN